MSYEYMHGLGRASLGYFVDDPSLMPFSGEDSGPSGRVIPGTATDWEVWEFPAEEPEGESDVIQLPGLDMRDLPRPPAPSPATTTPAPATTEDDKDFLEEVGEDIGAAFSSLWDKMNASDQTQIAAEDIAREEGGIAKAGMAPVTTPAPAAAPAAAPATARVVVDPEPSWAARYAPFMILGGLGVGAAVVLVLAMRKKKRDRPSW